jgi:hypothetical protein
MRFFESNVGVRIQAIFGVYGVYIVLFRACTGVGTVLQNSSPKV